MSDIDNNVYVVTYKGYPIYFGTSYNCPLLGLYNHPSQNSIIKGIDKKLQDKMNKK